MKLTVTEVDKLLTTLREMLLEEGVDVQLANVDTDKGKTLVLRVSTKAKRYRGVTRI